MLSVCKDYRENILPWREGGSGGALPNVLPAIIQPAQGFPCAPLHAGAPGRLAAGSLKLLSGILAVQEL